MLDGHLSQTFSGKNQTLKSPHENSTSEEVSIAPNEKPSSSNRHQGNKAVDIILGLSVISPIQEEDVKYSRRGVESKNIVDTEVVDSLQETLCVDRNSSDTKSPKKRLNDARSMFMSQ